jgi:hypothetical protein
MKVGLDLDQYNSAMRQLMIIESDFEAFCNPTKCAHILEDVNSAYSNAATWF